jgi:hypothetical protein
LRGRAEGIAAIVSSIFLGPEESRGSNRKRLDAFEKAGFDEAVILLLPKGPSAGKVRGLGTRSVPPRAGRVRIAACSSTTPRRNTQSSSRAP